ncbi:MAG: glycosyltransferase [Acidobacteria bacterium]|nr:glycosyltransferase [Acidobacteriota bacterium]
MRPAADSGLVLVAAAAWHDEHPGGANKLPTDFARFLARRGRRVAYLGASSNVASTSKDAVDGVEVWRYPSPRATSPSVANLQRHWRAARAIAGDIHRESPVAALLGHAPLQYLAAAPVCGAARRCYAVHSPFVEELRQGMAGSLTLRQRAALKAAAVVERRVLASSQIVHYDSAFTAHLVEAAYPGETAGKGIVLAGWVDATRFRPPAEARAAVRRRLGRPWQPGTPTFFTLRRLVPRMGIDALVEAAALLAGRGLDFRVIVAGEGPCRAALEAQAASLSLGGRIAFAGRLADAQLVDSFGAADCFVLPTRALECFGLIVLESLACGVPVIGMPVGSIPEVMGQELSSWLAARNDAASLARRMEEFLAGALTAEPATLRARALEFSFEAVAARHEALLLGTLARGAVA